MLLELETAKGEIQALQARSPVSSVTVESIAAFITVIRREDVPSTHTATALQPTSVLAFAIRFVGMLQPI